MDHIGESAELYALGLLDPTEAAAVNAHAAQCGECLARLAEAEATMLDLESAAADVESRFEPLPPLFVAPRWRYWGMVAAAFAIGLLPWLATIVVPNRAAPTSDAAVVAMLHGHFSHAQFARRTPSAPSAKAIYARDRSWAYVIVDGRSPYRVVVVDAAGHSAQLGTTAASVSVTTLYKKIEEPNAAALDLLDPSGNVIEEAKLR